MQGKWYQVRRTVLRNHASVEFEKVNLCYPCNNRDAKELAQRCGIPTIPGYSGADQSTARLQEEINKIGYPVLLKASMGGGGRVPPSPPHSSLGHANRLQFGPSRRNNLQLSQ